MADTNASRRKRRPVPMDGDHPRPLKKTGRRSAVATPVGKKTKPPPDMSAILGRFSDALAIVETACNALDAAQESENPMDYICPGVSTLRHGIKRIQQVYNEFDLAI